MTVAPPPAEPSDAATPRCPACGQAVLPGSAFCATCGRPLTPLPPGSSGFPSTNGESIPGRVPQAVPPGEGANAFDPSVPRPPGAPKGGSDLPSRPLNAEERDQILRLVRSPGATAAAAISLFAGLAALTLSTTEFLGVVYDPTNFLAIVIGASMIALVAGGGAMGLVRPPRGALRYGRAIELNGIPARDSLKVFGHTGLQMGPVRLMVPNGPASSIRIGEPLTLTVALGVPPLRTPGFGLVPRGILLRVNGSSLPRPPIVFVTW